MAESPLYPYPPSHPQPKRPHSYVQSPFPSSFHIAGALSAGMQAVRMNWGWFKDQDLRADVPVIEKVSDVLQYV